MSRPAGCLFLLAILALPLAVGAGEPVIAVELASPHRLPEALVRSALGELTGRPFSRLAVREALARLWSLGLFAAASVEAEPDPAGIRLIVRLQRRPLLRQLEWEGSLGLDPAELAEAAGLARGGSAEPERLEEARRRILARYRETGYLAARVEIAAREEPATNERDLTIRLEAGRPAIIDPLEVAGAEGEAAELVARTLRLYTGARYREREVRERLRDLEERLWAEGFFQARVRLAASDPDPDAATIRLAVQIAAGPRYRVEFDGVSALAESALRARLALEGALEIDDHELSAAARQLEAAYREAGYPFAGVEGVLVPDGADAARTIRFAVEEGPAVAVERVEISGNQAVPARRLLELIETRPPGLLRAAPFRRELLDRDLRVLLAFYRSLGYAEAAVGPAAVELSADRTRARIVIPVREGPLVRVGRLEVEGAVALSTAEILAAVPFAPGEAWSEQRGEEARRAVARRYARLGYLAAEVTLAATRRGEEIDLAFRIREGAPTRIGRIRVGGLLLTRERVVRRELPFRPGEPFDPERLQDAERRLVDLGLFERVEVGPLRPAPLPFADVDVTLAEGKPWRLDLGGGYSTDQEWRGFFELGHDNLFGTGRSATFRETVASKGDRSDLSYRTRRVFETPWQAEASLFRERWDEIGYRRQTAGGTAGIQRPLFPERIAGLRVFLNYRLNWIRRLRVSPSLAAADVVAGSQLLASLTPAMLLDRRDDPRDPSRGSAHQVALEVGAPAFGSEVNFVKFQLETRWFLDWLRPTVLALSGRLGLAAPYGGTAALDIADRFKAGGITTIRGYPEDRVGPADAAGNPVGGNARALLNAEWRFPIWRWLGGALFADSGTVAREAGDLRGADLKTGVGGGFRIKTPVGPLRMDVGYALNALPTRAERWQLSFSIGHAF